MSAAATPAYTWTTLPWRTIEQTVFKLQQRIYQAARRGDIATVHHLQRLVLHSWAARCLAVRRVTQDNRGKRTAGVDGVSRLTPAQRLDLAQTLSLGSKARPTRRVWLPKPGTTERRPLGIPTMRDRATQALVKLALEPEWEARFEPNSFGFRPGRSAHDAVQVLFDSLRFKAKYALDADIAKCFDRIDHAALLTKLRTTPTLRRAIQGWLRAGVMDGPALYPTTAGTPQGGVLSPLLANVALHGLETAICAAFPARRPGSTVRWKPQVVRYADDFVVLHEDRGCIEQAQRVAEQWLADMGLALKPSKTHIAHTLHAVEGHAAGFDFLGFHVRHYPVGKTHSARTPSGQRLGFKLLIKPSRAACKRHSHALRSIVRQGRAVTQAVLISRLNPLIRGWAAYYSTVVASASFAKLDNELYVRLRRWSRRRHPMKPRRWVARHYWRLETGRWLFGVRGGLSLRQHAQTPIRRHAKVQHARSPFDGDWAYWGSRLGTWPELPPRITRSLKAQHGRCAWCGLVFRAGDDVLESDHIVPRTRGGRDDASNRQLLHGHCHDQKTARETTRGVVGAV